MKMMCVFLIFVVMCGLYGKQKSFIFLPERVPFTPDVRGMFIEYDVFKFDVMEKLEAFDFLTREVELLHKTHDSAKFWADVWFYSFLGTALTLVGCVLYIVISSLIPSHTYVSMKF